MRNWAILVTSILFPFVLFGQCPTLNDGEGNPSNNPYWVHCFNTNYTLNISSPDNIGSYTVDWGDGSPTSSGASLIPPNTISHTYTAAVDTFNVTFTETSSGCVINGVVVMEEFVNASIQIPVGGVTQICAPGSMAFINSTTNVSPTTSFTWDFGDGSPIEFYDFNNAGQTLSHMYLSNTVNCETEVTLTAENYCSNGVPTVATFNPVLIWDFDIAGIDASATTLCYPDTMVHFDNAPDKNCINFGNTAQRYEYWNFGNYWGTGQDSIVDWLPYDPPNRPGYDIAFPGLGTYTISIRDSNICGIDDASITIDIISPPTALLSSDKDTICAGDSITFFNNSIGGANFFQWDFGDGSPQENGFWPHTHPFSTPGNYTVTLFITNTGGSGSCVDSTTLDVVVLASPNVDFLISDTVACDSATITFTDISLGAVGWNWDFGNGNSNNTSTPPPIFYSSPNDYIVTLEAEGLNMCPNSISKTIHIYQSPDVDFFPKNVCEGFTSIFLDSSTSSMNDPITYWFWDFGDGDTSNLEDPTHLYASSDTFNVIHAVSTEYCSNSDTFEVIVEPKPNAVFTTNILSGCSPVSVSFTNSSSGATIYNWNFGDGSTSNLDDPTHVFTNSSSSIDSTYQVLLVASSNFGCTDTAFEDITAFYNPTALYNSNAILDCAPLIVEFNNLSTGATNYLWNMGTGDSLTQINPTYTFENQTLFISNYEVMLTASNANGCTYSFASTITVYPEPIFTFSAVPDSGCSPLEVEFPSIIGAVSYQWDFGDGNLGNGPTPTHTYYNSTTNNVTFDVQLIAINSFGCADTSVETVLVQPKPSSSFTIDQNAGCEPLTIDFQNTSTGAVSFYWDFGNGDTTNNATSLFSYTYENPSLTDVTFEANLIVESQDGCLDTSNQNINVYPRVIASYIADSVGCAPLPVSFLNTSSGATSYSWTFGDGQQDASTNPSHVYLNPNQSNQVYTSQLIATNSFNCTDTAVQTVVIYPKPIAEFNINPIGGCTPLFVQTQNISIGTDSNYWYFGDGDTLSSIEPIVSHIYENTGLSILNYSLELIAENAEGCKDTADQNISVFPGVTANFSTDTIGCSPLQTDFMNESIGADFYLWDFGNGNQSSIENPSQMYMNNSTNTTTIEASLVASNTEGCSDTTIRNITVYHKPQANFTINSNIGCEPFPVNIQNNSSGADLFFWNFGDGDTSQSSLSLHTHTYENPSSSTQNFELDLIVSTLEGCYDTLNQNIEVYPRIIADFSVDTSGCSPIEASFSNSSTGASSYFWNFGDGNLSVEENPTHEYTNTGVNDLNLTIQLVSQSTFGCLDTAFSQIIIHPTPIANFIATPTTQQYPSSTVSIINNSSNGLWNYTWEFNNGSSSSNQNPGSITYDTWGTYTIQLSVFSDYCFDSSSQQIIIEPPIPIVEFIGSGEGCRPLTVTFTNNTIYGANYYWEFGDGGTSTSPNPTYTYYSTGTYTVQLTSYGHGGDTATSFHIDSVIVHENAQAAFNLAPTEVTIPNEPVQFFNLSSFANDYLWDFGDSSFSQEENPSHLYLEEGIYTVTLWANNEFDCKDSFILENAVIAEISGEIVFPNAFTPNTAGPTDGKVNPTALNNDIFYPIAEGVIDYHLMIFNRWGELIFESFDQGIGWDGYYRGEPAKQDVYVWKVEATLVNGSSYTKAGDVTLIR